MPVKRWACSFPLLNAFTTCAKSTYVILGMAKPACISQVTLYGDVVLRFVSGSFTGPFMPMFENVDSTGEETLGIQRLDHAVGNVHKLDEAAQYLMGFTGVFPCQGQRVWVYVLVEVYWMSASSQCVKQHRPKVLVGDRAVMVGSSFVGAGLFEI